MHDDELVSPIRKGAHDIALEFVFEINDIKWKAELHRDHARVVQIVERAAARRQRFAVRSDVDAPLIPELHRKSDQVVTLIFQ